eukprot:m.224003 g.224003  ORF g.224003 m.224003 type:complete len:128 (+) comp39988_c1_seq6:2615-2998(+)
MSTFEGAVNSDQKSCEAATSQTIYSIQSPPSSSHAVVYQPGAVPTVTSTITDSPPSAYRGLSIFSILFCFPLGIFALISGGKVSELWMAGNSEGALRQSRRARNLSVFAILFGIVIIAINIVRVILL